MSFSSPFFFLLFLPVSLAGFYVLGGWRAQWGFAWLLAVSLMFYGYGNPSNLLVLFVLIGINFGCSRIMARAGVPRRAFLIAGIVLDISVLAYFKYRGFFAETVHGYGMPGVDYASAVMPLGISFVTFQIIAYLVDSYRGETAGYSFFEFCLFLSFFPKLIAGPIIRHADVMSQFKKREIAFRSEYLSVGVTMFIIGLAKKVLIADGIGILADTIFSKTAVAPVSALEAWCGALAYTFQLYFDFSGYCDMAFGAARMFGIALPFNFDSPYKSRSIIEFWRRWHITLSQFLRDYLYIPLGGNRRGYVRQMINLLITMVIGGIWHGAGWTFVIWGAVHGVFLVINHGWRRWRGESSRSAPAWVGWPITFVSIVISWVIFRSASVHDALAFLGNMAGWGTAGFLPAHAIANFGYWIQWIAWLFLLGFISFFLPNTQQWMAKYLPTADAGNSTAGRWHTYSWKPSTVYALGLAILFTAAFCVIVLSSPRDFLYFQF